MYKRQFIEKAKRRALYGYCYDPPSVIGYGDDKHISACGWRAIAIAINNSTTDMNVIRVIAECKDMCCANWNDQLTEDNLDKICRYYLLNVIVITENEQLHVIPYLYGGFNKDIFIMFTDNIHYVITTPSDSSSAHSTLSNYNTLSQYILLKTQKRIDDVVNNFDTVITNKIQNMKIALNDEYINNVLTSSDIINNRKKLLSIYSIVEDNVLPGLYQEVQLNSIIEQQHLYFAFANNFSAERARQQERKEQERKEQERKEQERKDALYAQQLADDDARIIEQERRDALYTQQLEDEERIKQL